LAATELGQKSGKSYSYVAKALNEVLASCDPSATSAAVVELLARFNGALSTTGLKPLAVILLSGVTEPSAQSRAAAVKLFDAWLEQGAHSTTNAVHETQADSSVVVRMCKTFDLGNPECPPVNTVALAAYVRAIWSNGEHAKALSLEASFRLKGNILDESDVLATLLGSKNSQELESYVVDTQGRTQLLQAALDASEIGFADKLATRWKLHGVFPYVLICFP
jgi:hypothetical protein